LNKHGELGHPAHFISAAEFIDNFFPWLHSRASFCASATAVNPKWHIAILNADIAETSMVPADSRTSMEAASI
jgi:hypothetical protein